MSFFEEVPTVKYDALILIGDKPVPFELEAANDLSAASAVSTLCAITAGRGVLVSGYSVRKKDGSLVVHVPVFSLVSAAGPHINKAAQGLVIPVAATPNVQSFDAMRDAIKAGQK